MKTEKVRDLKKLIVQRQADLQRLAKAKGGHVGDPEIYRLSCEIDKLVVEYMRLNRSLPK